MTSHKMHSTLIEFEDSISTAIQVTWCNTMGQHFYITEQGKRCCSKLISHIWLPICVSNKHVSTEGTLKGHVWFVICILSKCCSYDELFIRYNHLKIIWHWFDLLMSSKVKGHKVNWMIMYDFVYVLHINIGHSMHRFWYIGINW